MQRIRTLDELSKLITAQFRRGVVTNSAFAADLYAREIDAGTLLAQQIPGGLLLFRHRDGFERLSFYLQPEAELAACCFAGTTMLELPKKPQDPAMQQMQLRWTELGFETVLTRQRMVLKDKIAAMQPTEGYSIRLAEPSDTEEIIRILNEVYVPETACFPTEEELRTDLPVGNVLVAVTPEHELAGVLRVLRAGNTMQIRHLAVEPTHRRRGIASQLLARIDALHDVKRTNLWVTMGNESAIGLYEKLGYACDGWTSTVLRYDEERKD